MCPNLPNLNYAAQKALCILDDSCKQRMFNLETIAWLIYYGYVIKLRLSEKMLDFVIQIKH